jgi:octaprenyl-diphosphate synthase
LEYATITASVREDLDAVEQVIVENLGSEVPLIPRVGDYVFSSGGKRFRPALLLLSARPQPRGGHRVRPHGLPPS